MDETALRNELAAQVREEFETHLREMRHEKIRAEEELEEATERWRAERRRLNAEIDRLEEENYAKSRKGPAADNADNTEELQRAFDDKFQQAAAAWDAERERLTSEISRLQAGIADALARSGNPFRVTQTLKDQYEVKLADANRVHLEAEREFMRTKADWEEDKKKIMGELVRLRRLVPASASQIKDVLDRLPGRSESVEEARIRELEGQLAQARATALKSNETSIRSAQDLTAARKDLQRLNAELHEIQEHMGSGSVDQLRHQYDARMQDLMQQRDGLLRELEATARIMASGGESATILPSSRASSAASDGGPLRAEVEQVEAAIKAIDNALDDPDTAASRIAQKNAEKAVLEAYLRGIRFQIGLASSGR